MGEGLKQGVLILVILCALYALLPLLVFLALVWMDFLSRLNLLRV